ncbi:MAG TPA: GTP cyclohydrolase I, partial [Gemmatimonadales bacterium]
MSSTKAADAVTRSPTGEPFADLVRRILLAIGEDPAREGLVKTPERVEGSLRFLTQGYGQTVAGAV